MVRPFLIYTLLRRSESWLLTEPKEDRPAFNFFIFTPDVPSTISFSLVDVRLKQTVIDLRSIEMPETPSVPTPSSTAESAPVDTASPRKSKNPRYLDRQTSVVVTSRTQSSTAANNAPPQRTARRRPLFTQVSLPVEAQTRPVDDDMFAFGDEVESAFWTASTAAAARRVRPDVAVISLPLPSLSDTVCLHCYEFAKTEFCSI